MNVSDKIQKNQHTFSSESGFIVQLTHKHKYSYPFDLSA